MSKLAWAALAFAFGFLFGMALGRPAHAQAPDEYTLAYREFTVMGGQHLAVRAKCPVDGRLTSLVPYLNHNVYDPEFVFVDSANCVNNTIGFEFDVPHVGVLQNVALALRSNVPGAFNAKFALDPDCGNDDRTACVITVPGSVQGVITYPGDADWFLLEPGQDLYLNVMTQTAQMCRIAARIIPSVQYPDGSWRAFLSVTGAPASCRYAVTLTNRG